MTKFIINLALLLLFVHIATIPLSKFMIKNITKSGKNIYLDTGDLMLFSSDTLVSYSPELKILGTCPWSHVGVVLRENNQLYILECTTDKSLIRGSNKIPISRINRYNGNVGIMKLNKPIPLNNIYYELGFEFDYEPNLLGYYLEKVFNVDLKLSKKGIHCCEYIGNLLQEWGVLNKSEKTCHILPRDFTSGNISKKMINGYYYLPTQYIIK